MLGQSSAVTIAAAISTRTEIRFIDTLNGRTPTPICYGIQQVGFHDPLVFLPNSAAGLRNVPVFAFGFSEQDVVSVMDVEGRLIVKEVVQRGGHSTYRMILPEPVGESEFDEIWRPFELLGCTYERGNKRTIAIDVPPAADVRTVVAVLGQGSVQGLWKYDEGYCASIH